MATKNIIKRIISSPLVQTFLIYVSGAWLVLEMTDYFINKYGLKEEIIDILPIVLLIGLPVALFLAWYLSKEKVETEANAVDTAPESKSSRVFRTIGKKPWFFLPGIVILILLIASGTRYLHRQIKIKLAIEQSLPEMESYLQDLEMVNAFDIRQKVKKYIPDDPSFKRLDSLITTRLTILTYPAGSEVFFKEYSALDQNWISLGRTPLNEIELPNWTLARWRFTKPGYDTVFAAAPTFTDTLFRSMHRSDEIPEGMVYVEGIYDQTSSNHLSTNKNGFFIDRYEITNRMYKEFMDAGGYQNPEYWHHDFIRGTDTLIFREAIEYFKDITGRFGPASWKAGDYPNGQDNHPVNGISWYEASAYATYAGKHLPTFWHWISAAGHNISQYSGFIGSNLVPLCNIERSEPQEVGINQGINCYGAFDMVGNVREWCWNKSPNQRIVLGGAYNDVGYMATNRSQLPEFDRSLKNGFRCVSYIEKDSIPEYAFQPVPDWGGQRDYRFEKPVSDMEFQIYKKQFLYDIVELDAQIEKRNEDAEDWIIETISLHAVYENERLILYLFLPKAFSPPFQTLIYFPGAGARNSTSIFKMPQTEWNLDYIIKNGRAILFPIYKGTYERRKGACEWLWWSESHNFSECLEKQIKDFSRSIDYLETRDDIDLNRLGFLGDSWGGTMGAVIPALEKRIKIAVLVRGGLPKRKSFPESDPVNFVSHVTTPVLMLNGKYDFTFPYETTVKPLYDLLGTQEEHKKLVLYDTDHFVPKTEMIKEVLNWLDTYFGPVRK